MLGSFANLLRHECPPQTIRPGGRTSAEDLDFRTMPAESGGMATMARVMRSAIKLKFEVDAHAAGESTRLHIERAIRELQLSLPGVPPLIHVTGEDLLRILAMQHYGRLPHVDIEADGPTLEIHPAGPLHGVWVSGSAGTIEVDLILDIVSGLPYGRRPQDVSLPVRLLQCTSKFEFVWGRGADLGTREDDSPLTDDFEGSLQFFLYYEPIPSLEIPVLMRWDGVDLVGTQPTIAPVMGRYVAAGLYRPGGQLGPNEARHLGVRWGARIYSEDTIPSGLHYLDARQIRDAEFGWLQEHADSDDTDHSAASFLPIYLPTPGRDGLHLGQLQDGQAQLRIKMDTLENPRTRMVRILALWHDSTLEQIRRLLELPPGALVEPITASHKPHPDPFMVANGLPLKVRAGAAGA